MFYWFFQALRDRRRINGSLRGLRRNGWRSTVYGRDTFIESVLRRFVIDQ